MKTVFQNEESIIKPVVNMLRPLSKKIKSLFQLEEVEITFRDTNKTGYSYTVVPRKIK